MIYRGGLSFRFHYYIFMDGIVIKILLLTKALSYRYIRFKVTNCIKISEPSHRRTSGLIQFVLRSAFLFCAPGCRKSLLSGLFVGYFVFFRLSSANEIITMRNGKVKFTLHSTNGNIKGVHSVNGKKRRRARQRNQRRDHPYSCGERAVDPLEIMSFAFSHCRYAVLRLADQPGEIHRTPRARLICCTYRKPTPVKTT